METATIREIISGSAEYPSLLQEISGAPERFFVIGNAELLKEPLVSIVGTRKATSDGILLAKQIAAALARRGVGVVSGLALGIDRAAHEGTLSGNGKTIAVLGNGLDEIYPRQHEHLAEKIVAQGGALVSEYPAGTPPYPGQFLERNRIVAGLALATIVIEAPIHSGSIRTARDAMEGGREVFVFPGPAGHPNYRGSHTLIRNGARLVSSFEDIEEDLHELFLTFPDTQKAPIGRTESTEEVADSKVLAAAIAEGGTFSAEDIILATGLPTNEVLSELAMLTIQGVISERNGQFCIK